MRTVTWMVIAISSPEEGQRPKVWVAAVEGQAEADRLREKVSSAHPEWSVSVVPAPVAKTAERAWP